MPTSPPARLLFTILAAALMFLSAGAASRAAGNTVSLETSSLIGQNLSRDGTVLFLDAPVSARPLRVVVIEPDGRGAARFFLSHKGRHAYETRNLPGWTGTAGAVLVADEKGIRGTTARPGLLDELDIFTAPLLYRPSLCNNEAGTTLFGTGTQTIYALLGAGIFIALLFVFKKHRVKYALTASFIAVLLLGDLQSGASLIRMVPAEDNDYVRQIMTYRQQLGKWSERIGNNTWSCARLPWHFELQTRYMLADRPYVPRGNRFIVRDKNGFVVLEETGK